MAKRKSVLPTVMPPRTELDELDEHADEIRVLGHRSFDDTVEIGRRLVRCRELLKTQRSWLAWLKTKFSWSRTHADSLIALYRRRAELQKFCTLLPVSTLYTLARQEPEVVRRIAYRVESSGPEVSTRALRVMVKKEVREVRAISYSREVPSPRDEAAQRFLQELRMLADGLPGLTPEQIAAAVPSGQEQRTAAAARTLADFLHELGRKLSESAPLELVAIDRDTKH